MDGLDAEQLTAAERRSEPGAGVALRVVRLAGTPSKSRSSEHGRLRACGLAVLASLLHGPVAPATSARSATRANRPFTGRRPPALQLFPRCADWTAASGDGASGWWAGYRSSNDV